MDLETLVTESLNRMPVVFTAADVVTANGLGQNSVFKINTVLKRLAERGVVVQSVLFRQSKMGRPPFAWSTDPAATVENLVDAAILTTLPRMPPVWTVLDLLSEMDLGFPYRKRFEAGLERLSHQGKVCCTSEVVRLRGPVVPRWTTHPFNIRMELKARADAEQKRRREEFPPVWKILAEATSHGSDPSGTPSGAK
jgi:hypothetical protein